MSADEGPRETRDPFVEIYDLMVDALAEACEAMTDEQIMSMSGRAILAMNAAVAIHERRGGCDEER